MRPEALLVASTTLIPMLGAVIGYMAATEWAGSDPVPEVHRGDSPDEPWGTPQPTREHNLPGFAGIMLPRDRGLDNRTAEYDIIDRTDDYELPDG